MCAARWPSARSAAASARARRWLAAVDLALRQLGLHAQAGQRRLHLVRGVGEEVLLHADRRSQAREHVVDRAHQRRDFFGQRRSSIGSGRRRARADALAAAASSGAGRAPARTRPAAPPAAGSTNCGRITPLMISLASCERLSSVSATCTSGGGRAPRPARQRHPEVGHAHRSCRAARRRESARSPCGRGRPPRRHRQVAVAVDALAARAEHLEVDAVDVVGAQDVARRRRAGSTRAPAVPALR